MMLSPPTAAPGLSGSGSRSQPQTSKRNEAIWVLQLLDMLSIPVNQKVQSSSGSRLIAA